MPLFGRVPVGARCGSVMLHLPTMCAVRFSIDTQAGQLRVAEALFQCADMPDAITYEAFIAACGIAGAPEKVGGLHDLK